MLEKNNEVPNIEGYDDEPQQFRDIYSHKLENNGNLSNVDKNQSSTKTFYNKEEYQNKHYICQDCSAFPLIKLSINKDKTIKLNLKCENHKEEIDLKTYVDRINKNNTNLDLHPHQYCKNPNHKDEIFLNACLKCKMNLCSECSKSHKEQYKDHILIKLDDLQKETINIIEILKTFLYNNIFPNENKKDYNSMSNKSFTEGLEALKNQPKTESEYDIDTLRNLTNLVFIIISDSETWHSYNHYENLKNLNSLFGEKLDLEYYSYENESETKIRLFGEQFVKKNKDKCSVLINDEFKGLSECEFYEVPDIDTHLNITLIKEKEITDMSYMFYDCYILSSIKNTSKWTTDKVTNMSYMFYNCKALVYLPNNVQDWNTSNVTDMSYMFYDCKSLPDFQNLLLDISKWKTSKVKDMSYMFYGCENFDDLNYITKWDTNLVENMCNMFSECLGLVNINNIFKWKTDNVTDMSYMFYNCRSLKDLGDDKDNVSFNTSKVTNMSNMFYGCEDMEKFPELISKWDTSQVQYMSYMFYDCGSLESLPEGIKDWKTDNVLHMNNMFENCKKLKKLPDITKWNINKLVDINNMIEGCDSLKDEDIPDIKGWNKVYYKQGKRFEKFFNSNKDD